MEKLKLFTNNEWVDAADGKVFEAIDPSKNEVIAELALAGKKDVDDAVKAAKNAFAAGWGSLDADARADYMLKAAAVMRKRLKELARWESLDVGKTISSAEAIDIPIAIRAMEYFANLSREVRGEVIPLPGNNVFDYVTYEPYGVVATVVPWNYPLHIATRSICPSLAAGNTVVLKPSSLASITSVLLGEVFLEAGFPSGVLNVVTGTGAVTGEALLNHPGIDMISLTGSVEVGKRALRASAENRINKVILELGGKGAFIAEPDCDLSGAVNSVLVGFCAMQGEICCASSRLFLHEDIYDAFMEKMVKRVDRIKIGDPLDPATQMGALISEEHLKNVDQAVKDSLAEGARLVYGGERYMVPPFDKGCYYKPTILENVKNSMKCAQEEIFGPVLVVIKYKDFDEAITMANDTQYALGATIWSEDVRKLYRAARKLDAGTVWMNTNVMSMIEAPYGGHKNSGLGKELGKIGLMEYLKVKNNMVFIGPEYDNFYGFED